MHQPQFQHPPPAPAPPSPFDGPEALRILFACLIEEPRPDAIACALRRLYLNERVYNDTRSAGMGVFDSDLVGWLSEAVACGKLCRDDATAAAGDAHGRSLLSTVSLAQRSPHNRCTRRRSPLEHSRQPTTVDRGVSTSTPRRMKTGRITLPRRRTVCLTHEGVSVSFENAAILTPHT